MTSMPATEFRSEKSKLIEMSPSPLAGDFKAAMRLMASTVSLITTQEKGRLYGMPATAVASLSAEPPSLLVCINQSASMHGPTSRTRHFCVNMLDRRHAQFCEEFGAAPSEDRFALGAWKKGAHDLPYLDDAAAAVFCRVEDKMHYGTHTIFIGRIETIIVDHPSQPLVYQAGRMGAFMPLAEPS